MQDYRRLQERGRVSIDEMMSCILCVTREEFDASKEDQVVKIRFYS